MENETISITFATYLLGGMGVAITACSGTVFYLVRHILTKYVSTLTKNSEVIERMLHLLEE